LIASNNNTGQFFRAPIIPVSAPISSSPSAPSTTLRWPIAFTADKYSRKSENGRGRRSAATGVAILSAPSSSFSPRRAQLRRVQVVQAVEQSGDRFEQLERFELFERRVLCTTPLWSIILNLKLPFLAHHRVVNGNRDVIRDPFKSQDAVDLAAVGAVADAEMHRATMLLPLSHRVVVLLA